MTDVLLISPSSKGIYQSLSEKFSAIETNIWAGLLGNSVRAVGKEAKILDLEVLCSLDNGYTSEDFVSDVQDINPKFVLFVVTGQNPNASSASMGGAVQWAEQLKEECPQYKIGFVGPHVNALPVQTLEKHSFIDFCLTNEGVYALRNLVNGGIDDLEHVNGLACRDSSGYIKVNPPEAVVPQERMEIDLPGVAYDLMPPLFSYRTSHWHTNYSDIRSPFASIYSSLGCSFKCNFCMINIINRTENGEDKFAGMFNKFRYWSPEFTIKQLDYLADHGVKHIKIADELFLNSPKHHAMPLCDLIIERGYNFNIWAYTRVNTVKQNHLEKLRKAGVNWLAIGIENSLQSVRQEIEKGKFSDTDITSVVKMIEEAGIEVIQNFIVGLPGETEDDAWQNLEFAQELNCAAYNVYPAMAIPGSQLYTEAFANNAKLPQSYSEFGFLSYDCVPLSNGMLSESDMLRIRDQAWAKYHTNPRFLDMIKNKFGEEAVTNIKHMTTIPLKRKLLGD